MGLSVSVTGERYGRETVGTIAIAARDIQHYTSRVQHKNFSVLFSYYQLFPKTGHRVYKIYI